MARVRDIRSFSQSLKTFVTGGGFRHSDPQISVLENSIFQNSSPQNSGPQISGPQISDFQILENGQIGAQICSKPRSDFHIFRADFEKNRHATSSNACMYH